MYLILHLACVRVKDKRILFSIQLCTGNIPDLGVGAVDTKYIRTSEKGKSTSPQLPLLEALFMAVCGTGKTD